MQVIQDCKGMEILKLVGDLENGIRVSHQRRDMKILLQIQASLELSKSRTGKQYFESASKSDQARNAKFVYCNGSGLAVDNRLQLEGLIEGAQICTNECLENIGAI